MQKNYKIAKILSKLFLVFSVLCSIGLFVETIFSTLGMLNVIQDASPVHSIPINIQNLNDTYELSQLSENYTDVLIEIEYATLSFSPKEHSFRQGLTYFLFPIILVMAIWMFWLLYKIAKSVASENAFTNKNFTRVKSIGILSIVAAFMFPIISYLQARGFTELVDVLPQGITLKGLYVDIDFFLDIINGLIIIALAEIFREGAYLQNLEDQTV